MCFSVSDCCVQVWSYQAEEEVFVFFQVFSDRVGQRLIWTWQSFGGGEMQKCAFLNSSALMYCPLNHFCAICQLLKCLCLVSSGTEQPRLRRLMDFRWRGLEMLASAVLYCSCWTTRWWWTHIVYIMLEVCYSNLSPCSSETTSMWHHSTLLVTVTNGTNCSFSSLLSLSWTPDLPGCWGSTLKHGPWSFRPCGSTWRPTNSRTLMNESSSTVINISSR